MWSRLGQSYNCRRDLQRTSLIIRRRALAPREDQLVILPNHAREAAGAAAADADDVLARRSGARAVDAPQPEVGFASGVFHPRRDRRAVVEQIDVDPAQRPGIVEPLRRRPGAARVAAECRVRLA